MKKRSLAFLLAILLVCSLGFATTLSVLAASNANDYKNELWLLLGQERYMTRGVTETSEGAPFHPEDATDTAYLPLDAVAKYAGATFSVSGNRITLTKGTDTFTLTAGSVAWQKNGAAQIPFLREARISDGVPYITILSARSLFGYSTYFDRDIGLIVLSADSISYQTNDKTTLELEVRQTARFLFEHPTGEDVFSDVVANVGEGAHPRLLADADRFETLRALWLTAQGETVPLDDPDEIRLRNWIVKRAQEASNSFAWYFVEVTGEELPEELNPDYPSTPGIYEKPGLALYYRHPYYFYNAEGKRLLGLGGKDISFTKHGKTVKIKSVFADDGSLLPEIYDADGNLVETLYDEHGYRVLSATSYEKTDSAGNVTIKEDYNYRYYGEGTDIGGRLSTAANLGNFARTLAFAYQITREQKYAEAVYRCVLLLGEYEHWGSNHFLNCADTASPVALAYDWTYHAFDDEPEKRDEMASILYEKGLYMGYIVKIGRPQDGIHPDSKINNYNYYNTKNNWNTVCNAGMILSALALFEYDEYREAAATVTGAGLDSLVNCLLQYAPDGAYIESPGYWYYGTYTYMILLSALQSAAGTTYGYSDTIGLHKSYYFARYITSPSGKYWNYHDSSRAATNYEFFYCASRLWNDPNLAAFRDESLGQDGYGTLFDILFYTPDLSESEGTSADLDYYMKGIETVTMRSLGGGADYTFTGLHAGANIATHGDHDSGNFYLEMGGKLWFGDAGSEDYNVGDYWGTERRYRYYRKSQEAHNTILIRSDDNAMRFGQTHNTEYQPHATITDFVTEKNGSYAVADMTAQYGSTCTSGTRGLLFTNARRTVIVQDEITFSSPTSLTWIATPNLSGSTLTFSEDGRTAYFTYYDTSGKRHCFRATLLSSDKSLKFETVEEKQLAYTIVKSEATPTVSAPQKRLAVKADDVTSFDVAVVFDLVSKKDDVVGYRKCAIEDWEITDDEWLNKAQKEYEQSKPNHVYGTGDLVAALKDIKNAATLAERYRLIGESYVIYLDMDSENETALKYMKEYKTYLDEINAMVREANAAFKKFSGEVLSRESDAS